MKLLLIFKVISLQSLLSAVHCIGDDRIVGDSINDDNIAGIGIVDERLTLTGLTDDSIVSNAIADEPIAANLSKIEQQLSVHNSCCNFVDSSVLAESNGNIKLRRGKRYLDFTRGTRMSWRTNVKNNIIQVNTLWAHAFGFRFNYPFPDKADRLRPFFKRDVLSVLEESLSVHGFDGRACVLKSYCSAILDTETRKGGMLFKLLKMLFSLDSHDKRHLPHLRPENCAQILHTHCPLSFNSISPFTDDN